MQIIFTALANFFTGLFSKFFLQSAYKIAVFASFITLLYAGIDAYFIAAKTMIGLVQESVPEIVVGVWGWVMPSNSSDLLLAIVSATMLRFVTNLYRNVLFKKFMTAVK